VSTLGSGFGCRTAAPPAGEGALPGADAVGEQHLFRVEVERKGAPDPAFRLALRQDTTGRFDLSATDPFGRALWRIEVGDRVGHFHDDREHWSCRFDATAAGALPRLDWGLAASDLPAVLLARVRPPAGDQGAANAPTGPFDFWDRGGRHWTGESDSRGAVWWFLETSTGRLEYRREASGSSLVDVRSAARIRWRELAAEDFVGRLHSLAEPAGELPECSDADLP